MEGLEKFIDEQIEKHGLMRALFAPASLLLALGGSAIPFIGAYGPLVALALISLESIVLAVYYRGRAERADERRRTYVAGAEKREKAATEVRRMLREYILELANAKWEYVTVAERFAISSGGDTRVDSAWTIQVTGDAPLHFMELNFWGPPLTEAERDTVDPVVRFGPEMAHLPTVDMYWSKEDHWDHLTVYAYFPRPISPGDETFALTVEYRWPRLFAGLTRGESEDQTWTFRRQPKEFRYVVTIDGSVGVAGNLRCGVSGLRNRPRCEREAGMWRIEGVEIPGPAANAAAKLVLDPS